MWIAEKSMKSAGRCKLLEVSEMKWCWLLAGAVGGMGLSALMAWNGGLLKLYNDIPSLFGYMSVSLLIYKAGIRYVNKFFEWACGSGFELYLLHSLVFAVMTFFLKGVVPIYVLLSMSLIAAYFAGYGYNWLLMKIKIK